MEISQLEQEVRRGCMPEIVRTTTLKITDIMKVEDIRDLITHEDYSNAVISQLRELLGVDDASVISVEDSM